MSQSYAAWYGTNAVDSILRIIGTEEGSTTTREMLKTMKHYISGLAVVGCLRVRNRLFSFWGFESGNSFKADEASDLLFPRLPSSDL